MQIRPGNIIEINNKHHTPFHYCFDHDKQVIYFYLDKKIKAFDLETNELLGSFDVDVGKRLLYIETIPNSSHLLLLTPNGFMEYDIKDLSRPVCIKGLPEKKMNIVSSVCVVPNSYFYAVENTDTIYCLYLLWNSSLKIN